MINKKAREAVLLHLQFLEALITLQTSFINVQTTWEIRRKKGGKIKTWNANLGVNVLLLQFDTFLMVPSRTIGMTFIFTYGLFDIVHQSLNAVFLCVIVWDCDLALQECVCVRLICIHLQNIWVIILEKMLTGVSDWVVCLQIWLHIYFCILRLNVFSSVYLRWRWIIMSEPE